MSQASFSDATWQLVNSHFKADKGYQLVKHLLDSYNDFVLTKIENIIDGFNPIEIHHQFLQDSQQYKYIIRVDIKNPTLSKPIIHEKDGSTKIMTPTDARNRNFTYAAPLHVDLHITTQVFNEERVEYETEFKKINNVCLGKIPVMVGSRYCVLSTTNMDQDECRYGYGGYFIINGNEKVVISQDRIAENVTYVFMSNKVTTYSHNAEIRSVMENKFSVPKTTSLKLSNKANQFGRYVRANIHHVKQDIPVFILFRALGVESDHDIINYIVQDTDPHYDALSAELIGSIEEGNTVMYVRDAREYLCRYMNVNGHPKEFMYNKAYRMDVLSSILEKEFLPHVGPNLGKKAMFLGYMMNKLLKCYLGIIPFDDRDSYINKRIDTPGILMANLFRQYYGKVVKDMKNMIQKDINSGSWKATSKFNQVITKVNVNKIVKSTIIESGLKFGLATGNWGIKSSKTKQGVAQVLNRMSYNAAISHMRRINTPIEKTGKLVQPRKLHITQWGIICPTETPEGVSVGLVKNLAVSATITVASNSAHLRERLLDADDFPSIKLFDGSNIEIFTQGVKIIINGDIIGITTDPNSIYREIKKQKREGIINIHTSVYWNIQGNELWVLTEGGRCTRPVYIVEEDNRLSMTPDIIKQVLDKKITWNDLVVKGVIEYLDVQEVNTAMIAMKEVDLSKGFKGTSYPIKYTHMEMDPSLILGVLAGSIPFSDHNQAPRNAYQCLKDDTLVLMSDGNRKMIKDVAVGDEVVTFHPETFKHSITKVIHQFVRPTDKIICKVTTISGRSIVATEDHLFMTNSGWKPVKDFDEDTLVGISQNDKALFVRVASVEKVENCLIADITVENNENQSFIAGDNFMVHNSAMSKQAIGVYTSTFRKRFDTLGHILHYPQVPMASTKIANLINHDDLPSGINAIVAISSYTGYNQEDSLIMNKSSVDRGLFASTYYRTYKDQNSKNHSTGEEEYYCKPDMENTKNLKPYNYNKITEEGFVPENTYVEGGDVIIGKCMPQRTGSMLQNKDSSVALKSNDTGVIDRNGYGDRLFTNVNGDGYTFSKVRIRSVRTPVIGDKLACFCDDHDVLTTTGWVAIDKLTLEHKVASMVGNRLVYQHPSELQEYEVDSIKLYNVDSTQVKFTVTDNHRCFVTNGYKKKPGQWHMEEAKDLYRTKYRCKKNVDVWEPDLTEAPEELVIEDGKVTKFKFSAHVDSVGKSHDEYIVDMDDWITFYGIWIAEGYVCGNNGGVRFAANKPRVKVELDRVCSNMGLNVSKNMDKQTDDEAHSWRIYNRPIMNFMEPYSVGAINKYLADWVWYLNREQSQLLLHSMCLGDGHAQYKTKETEWRYTTSSTRLADDFMRLCLHAGYATNKLLKSPKGSSHPIYVKEKQHIITQNADSFNLSVIRTQLEPSVNKNLKSTDDSKAQDNWVDFTGKVFCCTVPEGNGIIYIRKAGVPVWSGNSRSAQKGSVGILYNHEEMPFTGSGLVPDLILNPHAIPSRMTISQLMECIMGKACCGLGTIGDASPFTDITIEDIAQALDRCGMERYGNELMYNPRTGEMMNTEIFIGPTYYQRLKHMVADKTHSRNANGPLVSITRQPAEGRARDGGLRLGEMEVECNWAHGTMQFLKERFMEASDNYRVFVCKKCGMMANVNPEAGVYECKPCNNNTSFSQIRIPYACKLLFQEVQTMSIGARFKT